MKTKAILVYEREYYNQKKDYIKNNYDIIEYISLNEEDEGTNLDGKEVISIYKDVGDIVKSAVVIVAVRLCPMFRDVIKVLVKLGVECENIHLLLDKANSFDCEDIREWRSDIHYTINHYGDVFIHVDGHSFLVETDNELFIIGEVFGQGSYHFYLPYPDVVVIDIGMNIGVASVYFAKQKNIKKIYSYEPFPATYAKALENIALNHQQDKIIAHPFGISNENKEMELSYDENLKGLMSTTQCNDHPHVFADVKLVQIKLLDVYEVIRSIREKHPTSALALKIDCEGGEYEIFQRLDETGLFSEVSAILMEWHNFDEHNGRELVSLLKKHEFFYHLNGFPEYSQTGELLAYNPYVILSPV